MDILDRFFKCVRPFFRRMFSICFEFVVFELFCSSNNRKQHLERQTSKHDYRKQTRYFVSFLFSRIIVFDFCCSICFLKTVFEKSRKQIALNTYLEPVPENVAKICFLSLQDLLNGAGAAARAPFPHIHKFTKKC